MGSFQYLKNAEHLHELETWTGTSTEKVILQQYKERKPLNKQLQKFYSDKVSKINCIDLVKNIESIYQVQQYIRNEMPSTLFENKGPAIRLRRRK